MDKHDLPPLFLNGVHIIPEDTIKTLGFVFDSAMTWKSQIVPKYKSHMSQIYRSRQFFWMLMVYHLCIKLSSIEYGHLLYYGAANSHLRRLDSLQCHAEGICSTTFSLLSSRCQAAAFRLICKLHDGEGQGIFQSFCPRFVHLQY